MPFLDTPDTCITNLTDEGRNLLARSKFGSSLVMRVVGWNLGRGGYNDLNPVKVTPIVDVANNSVGYIEVIDNIDWDAGDKIVLNNVPFEYSVIWNPGPTAAQTALNILAAIQDSSDPRVYNLITSEIDPGNSNRIKITSLVTGNVLENRTFTFLPGDVDFLLDKITMPAHGFPNAMRLQLASTISLPNGVAPATDYYVANATEDTFQLSSTLNLPTIVPLVSSGVGVLSLIPTGNLYPINNNEVVGLGATINFLITPMSLATSMNLIDPAYPVPPNLGTFALPEGALEMPTSTSVSFVMQVPDGLVGMNAYGEVGVWVEILQSDHPLEIGRKVLFAYGHFPILAKTDRTLLTFRVIIAFG